MIIYTYYTIDYRIELYVYNTPRIFYNQWYIRRYIMLLVLIRSMKYENVHSCRAVIQNDTNV